MPRHTIERAKAPSGKSRSRRTAKRSANSGERLRLYMLDVGTQQYGDCILCQLGDRFILVDGGHPADFRGTNGHQSIPSQLESIFGHSAPFPIDLLVATHCHLDHIGCLPDLVANDLQVKWALVADEKMGFPSGSDMGGDAPDNPAYRLVAALTEENYADGLDDAGVNQFLQDAARLQDRYSAMLEQLDRQGRLLRYVGPDTPDLEDLEQEFSEFGLKVLGPTLKQLEICQEYLRSATQDIADQVRSIADALEPESEVALYRSMARRAADSDAEDRPGPGAAKNDQSIVLRLTVAQNTVLLTGDMQFAVPEVPNLDGEMADLLKRVDESGPYTFIKLAHHGSYNGLDGDVFKDWEQTSAFACSSGTNDATHPNSQVLALLKSDADNLEWARTDKNGLVTIEFNGDKPSIEVSRGKLNDFSPAAGAGGHKDAATLQVGAREFSLPSMGETSDGTAEFGATLQVGEAKLTLSLKVPPGIRSAPSSRARQTSMDRNKVLSTVPSSKEKLRSELELAGKRELPKLLFVTHRAKLIGNIGADETQEALRSIRDAGQTVLEVADPQNPFPEVHKTLEKSHFAGVVLLGGYDVLLAQRLDVLDADLRKAIGNQAARDGDNFIVWSDEAYTDLNGDSIQDLPVARIPDSKSSRLVFNALGATSGRGPSTRFGIRNQARPFAEQIFQSLQGNGGFLVSQPTSPESVGPANVGESGIYLMLHGSDADGSRFWGEVDGGDMFEAIRISNLAAVCPSVVFTGCCWGALTIDKIASRARSGDPIPVRAVEASIALAFLQAGATGFVGCTGSHYSPLQTPYGFYGGPMHDAFWKRYNDGGSPAPALHEAKQDFLAGFPHGRTTDIGHAIELKIFREYTCLGLGW